MKLVCVLAVCMGCTAVLAQPVIVSPPRNSTNVAGETATFSVSATGTPPLQYQWRFGVNQLLFGPLPGETNASLVMTNLTPPGGRCDVIVSNMEGAVTSAMARLVVVFPPSFFISPSSQLVTQGTRLTLQARAQPELVNYQWQWNGRALPGETRPELLLPSVQKVDAGDYACVAMDGFARATSQVARVEVTGLRGVTLSFVNFETPLVHPIALSPDGATLAVCNLPDNRLELFDLSSGEPMSRGSVTVGLDPVSVRFRTPSEAWVVNAVSDSISVVDTSHGRVVATVATPDTPADVAFAGQPERAFVSCALPNVVEVYNPFTRQPTSRITIDGERPKSLAVSLDGRTVYAAIFESGNGSTILGTPISPTFVVAPPSVVDHTNSPYQGQNPPPNSGTGFDPPIRNGLGQPPRVAHIVKKTDNGRWMDDNGGDWTEFVSGTNASLSGRPTGWDLPDRDVAMIDTATYQVRYSRRLMNICMDVAVNPASGQVTVVGTDALNEIRFEPNLNGVFLRVLLGLVDPVTGSTEVKDLNPHLNYAFRTVPDGERAKSVGDPRALVWRRDGTRAYVAGLGSDNVIVLDTLGQRARALPLEVGEGPAGLALDEARGRLYVLNRFAATISVVDTETDTVVGTVRFFDPTPRSIAAGRKHLYNTRKTSGLGHISCASCHVDARMDRLAWDLGDPSGSLVTNPAPALAVFHPMKGPMVTTTFQDMIGHEPLHWRGDRRGLEEFNPTFTRLQSAPHELTADEMAEFKLFLASIQVGPNPYRQFDNSLSTNVPLPGHVAVGLLRLPAGTPLPGGDAERGLMNFELSCVGCHRLPSGLSEAVAPPDTNGNLHLDLLILGRNDGLPFKGSQLRNMVEKFGMDTLSTTSRAGFGFTFNGRADSLTRFLQMGFPNEITTDEATADMIAFLLSMSGSEFGPTFAADSPPSKDVPAAVGRQLTLDHPERTQLFEAMLSLATRRGSRVELVAKGSIQGRPRGWVFDPLAGRFQSDRAAETFLTDELVANASFGSELTFTMVPRGTGRRIGIDRDEDGLLDQDERDVGSDPAQAQFQPLLVLAPRRKNANEVVLTWNTVPGHGYRAEFSTQLISDDWQSVGFERVADADTLSVVDRITGQVQRFYRVVRVD